MSFTKMVRVQDIHLHRPSFKIHHPNFFTSNIITSFHRFFGWLGMLATTFSALISFISKKFR